MAAQSNRGTRIPAGPQPEASTPGGKVPASVNPLDALWEKAQAADQAWRDGCKAAGVAAVAPTAPASGKSVGNSAATAVKIKVDDQYLASGRDPKKPPGKM